MRICTEKTTAPISVTGVATPHSAWSVPRTGIGSARERTSNLPRAKLLKRSTVKPPGAAPCRRSTGGLIKHPPRARPRAGPPEKSTSNRPKEGLPSRRYGSATRNTRRLIENPPGPGTACDPAWENKAYRANKTVWFLLPRSSPICPVLAWRLDHRNTGSPLPIK